MQNTTGQMPAMQGEVGYVIGMLWVLMLMLPVLVAFVGKKTNEQKMRSIGFELEVIKTQHAHSDDSNHSLATWITKLGEQTTYDGYTHEVKETTKIVTDGSLNGGGIEIVSPPLVGTKRRRKWLTSVCSALAGLVKIDTSCGVHHHEQVVFDGEIAAGRRVIGRIGLIYGVFQGAINELLPNSRRNNSYASRMDFMVQGYAHNRTGDIDSTSMNLYELMYNHGQGRYLAVNPHCIGKYGTVEFRQHGGSFNAVKLDSWSQILGAITNRAWNMTLDDMEQLYNLYKKPEGGPLQVTDLMWYLGFSDRSNLAKYAVKRAAVLRGVIQAETCPNCGKLTCAGCQATTVNQWADVHNMRHPLNATWLSVSRMLRQINAQLPQGVGCNFTRSEELTACEHCTGSTRPEYGSNVNNYTSVHIQSWMQGGNTGTVRGTCDNCELAWTILGTVACDDPHINLREEAFRPNNEPSYHFSAIGLGLVSMVFSLAPAFVGIMLLVGCGIGAIHGAGKAFNNRNRFKDLFVALKVRGSQASGFAWIKPSKPKTFMYVKAAKSSAVMAHNVRKHMGEDVLAAIGHTRFSTHGANNDENAHPHFSSKKYICLVHNGVVHNHDDVWTALKRKPTGPVDSQAVAEALEVGGIEEVVKHAEGSMSLIWFDSRDPQGTLKFWTNGGNPLSFGRLDRNANGEGLNGGPVAVASTTDLLIKSMGPRLKKHWECVIGREYTVHPDGTMTNRDIKGSEETAGFTYDWRTYATTVGMYGNKPKTKGSRRFGRILPNRKVKGNADNCEIPAPKKQFDAWGNLVTTSVPTRVKYVTDKDMQTPYDLMDDTGSWPSYIGERGVECHGYDAVTHCGLSPDGERYYLPAYLQLFHVKDQLRRFLNGEYEDEIYSTWGRKDNFATEWAHAGKYDEHWR